MANLTRIIEVTGTQWNHIVEYGSIVIGGTTYFTDENTIFLIDDIDTFGAQIEFNATVSQKNSVSKVVVSWSEVAKYKFIVINATHSAGRCNIVVPVSLIPYVATTCASTSELPSNDTSADYRFISRLYTSSATETNGIIATSFICVTSSPSQPIQHLAIYLRNHTNANRNMRVYFIGRNEEVY